MEKRDNNFKYRRDLSSNRSKPNNLNKKVTPVAISNTVRKYVNKRLQELGWIQISIFKEALSSCAIENNLLASELLQTFDRIDKKLPIGDRYLLQLGWFLRDEEDKLHEEVHGA